MPTERRPLLVVVTGRPGSGKTTLSERLASELRLPLVSRDRIKEGRLHTEGPDRADDRELVREVYEAFFQTVEYLLAARVSLVAEAAFQHKVWRPRILPLLEVSEVRLVVCRTDPQTAHARMILRAKSDPVWERYHPLPEGHRGAEEPYEAPDLDVPMMNVDTTQGYAPEFEEIVSFLR